MNTTSTVKIVWNGTDRYIEADRAAEDEDYDFDGRYLYNRSQRFEVFEAVRVDDSCVEDEGIVGTEIGYYRPVSGN